MYKKSLTPEQALQKLRHYCGYQERSHQEVRDKLYSLGVRKADHDAIISELIEGDYLNEERFAEAFARGHFRMKQWGRVRIRYELKQRQVSEYLVRKAMQQIDEEDYLRTLEKLARTRYESLRSEQYLIRKKKTLDHLLSKGYEPALSTPIVNRLIEENREKGKNGDEGS